MNRFAILLTAAALSLGAACAHASPTAQPGKYPGHPTPAPAPRPASSAREPVTVARSAPAIVALLKQARAEGSGTDAPENPSNPSVDETVTQVQLGGQCGFAGCSSSTLVAFTYRTRGANTTTRTVLALVSCDSVGKNPCTAVPAEVRATASPNPTQ